MKFTKDLVDDLADKLLIGLTEEENAMVLNEFAKIDKDIDIVNTIDNLENVDVMSHALDIFALNLRDDVASPSPSVDDLLKNSELREQDVIEVPKVVE